LFYQSYAFCSNNDIPNQQISTARLGVMDVAAIWRMFGIGAKSITRAYGAWFVVTVDACFLHALLLRALCTISRIFGFPLSFAHRPYSSLCLLMDNISGRGRRAYGRISKWISGNGGWHQQCMGMNSERTAAAQTAKEHGEDRASRKDERHTSTKAVIFWQGTAKNIKAWFYGTAWHLETRYQYRKRNNEKERKNINISIMTYLISADSIIIINMAGMANIEMSIMSKENRNEKKETAGSCWRSWPDIFLAEKMKSERINNRKYNNVSMSNKHCVKRRSLETEKKATNAEKRKRLLKRKYENYHRSSLKKKAKLVKSVTAGARSLAERKWLVAVMAES